MILPYPLRLLFLCLATFFLTHAVLSVAALAAAPAVLRNARRARAGVGAGRLLTLRLAPTAVSLLLVALVCVPSFLWFEPDAIAEAVSPVCLAAAAMAALVWGSSIWKAARSTLRSAGFARRLERMGRRSDLDGVALPVWVVEGDGGLIALTGLAHPRVFASRAVLGALPPAELAVALRHERAHWSSRDNLKRLFLLLAPEIVPFSKCFGQIERAWMIASEWAADDRAAANDPAQSLLLASALVRVARMRRAPLASAVACSLLDSGSNLEERVERLLRAAPLCRERSRSRFALAGSAALVPFAMLALRPSALSAAHELFERLMR